LVINGETSKEEESADIEASQCIKEKRVCERCSTKPTKMILFPCKHACLCSNCYFSDFTELPRCSDCLKRWRPVEAAKTCPRCGNICPRCKNFFTAATYLPSSIDSHTR
jgi:hypothetical protein